MNSPPGGKCAWPCYGRVFDCLLNHDLNQGKSVDVQYGSTRNTLLLPRGADFGAENVSVYLGYEILFDLERNPAAPILATDDLRFLRARIQFGIGGVTFPDARIDLLQNFFVSFPAASFNLLIDYEKAPTIPDRPVPTGPRIRAYGAFGYSSKGSAVGGAAPARLTEYVGPVAAGQESDSVRIPAYATAVVLQARATGAAVPAYNYVLKQDRTNTGDGNPLAVNFPTDGSVSDAIVLANGAQYISVTNNTGEEVTFGLVFYLNF